MASMDAPGKAKDPAEPGLVGRGKMGSRAHTKDENTFFLLSCEMPCLLLSIRAAGSLLSPLPHLNFSTEPNTEKHREPNLS